MVYLYYLFFFQLNKYNKKNNKKKTLNKLPGTIIRNWNKTHDLIHTLSTHWGINRYIIYAILFLI